MAKRSIVVVTLLLAVLAGFPRIAAAAAAAALAPPRHGGVYVVAHRGAHQGIPENTLAAYSKAIALGCDFVEVDVRTTKDGQLVSIHNSTIDAYTNGGATGLVKDMTLAQLQALDIGSRVGPQFKEERIPTMESIFALCEGKIGIYLDMKDVDVKQLLELVRAHHMENSCLWYSSPKQTGEIQAQCPECFPMPDPGPEKMLPRIIARFHPRVIANSWDAHSASYVQACHDAGALLIVDEENATSWQPAVEWHTDGIQTNDPEGLIKFLEDRKVLPEAKP